MKTTVQTLFFFFLIRCMCFAQGFWTKIGEMPESRYGHTVDEINGKIYVIGGSINEGSAYPTSSLVYDRSSGEWSQITLYNNSVRGAHNSCLVDGKLYVVGGWDGIRTVATMEMLDPNTGEWTSKMPMPTDRGIAASVTIDGKIYVIGGIRGTLPWDFDWGGTNKVEVYDTKNDVWIQAADMPTKRWGCSAVAFNGKIYVFGGRSSGNPYGSIEVYDPQKNKWTTNSNSMPTPRYCFTTCLLDDNIYAIGGWYNSASGPIYDKVEVYNPVSDKWKRENPLPVKLAVLTSIALNGKIYVYGGARTTHPNIGTSGIYEHSYYDIYAQEPCIDKVYARKGIDSVLFTTKFSNLYSHQFTPHLISANSANTQIDSLTLFDDGLHGDLLANDGVYGVYIPPIETEDYFILSLGTIDHQNNQYYTAPDQCRFTTVGPVVLDSLSIKYNSTSKDYKVKPYIHNNSTAVTITQATVKLICDDNCVTSISPDIFYLNNINPGSTALPAPTFSVKYDETLFPGHFDFKVEIQNDGFTYWTDSMRTIVTGVDEKSTQPLAYSLQQNYPNPFNPTTTLSFVVGHLPAGQAGSSFVTLKVYDVLGNEVATLVNERKPAGTYEVTWNPRNLSSGVYFYRLQAGSYIETKKMLMIK
jgi:N-acetylneuraminic acid mutarotase